MALDPSQANPPTALDQDEIVQHMGLYIDGFDDPDNFRRCFHPEARIICICDDGQVCLNGPIADYFDEWSQEDPPACHVLSVLQAGDVARVLLVMGDLNRPEDRWVDIHALLRLDGAWTVTNKTAVHASHAAWAGVEPWGGGYANAPDRDQIVQHMQLYIDGFNQSDAEKFRQCFHEDSWILFTQADGTLGTDRLWDVFEDWAGPDETKDYVHRILSVTQAGDVASVVLEMQASNQDDAWVDFHSLLRIDGKWRDTNKTATHASRAGWGGK
jgi:hypothetical protein